MGESSIGRAGVAIAGDADAAACRSEFDRVGDEIEQNLLESLSVRCHENFALALRDCQCDPFRLRLKRAKSLYLGEHSIYWD